MDLYYIALYLHVLALLGGMSATTLVHLGVLRLQRADTGPDARQWHALRSRALAAPLRDAGDGPLPAATRALVHDPLIATLPWVNLMIVLATAFVMVVKPALMPALASMLLALAVGLLLAGWLGPQRAFATSDAAVERG